MEREMIRKAEKKDISRIAEILVFDKRIKYRPIFKDDAYCFGKLQILAVSEQYGASGPVPDRAVCKRWVISQNWQRNTREAASG